MDMIRTVSDAAKTALENSNSNNNSSSSNNNNNGETSSSKTSGLLSSHGDHGAVQLQAAFPDGSPAEIPPEAASAAPAQVKVEATDGDYSDWGDEEEDYEYEDHEDFGYSGFLVDNPLLAATRTVQQPVAATATNASAAAPATIQDEEEEAEKRPKWREPTRDAVKMSLRAEKETSGGKRRLAQDLYRIMNQDTLEAGFSLQPSQEDSMDKWTIKLFKFDADSNLAKDMIVLGLDNVELEMAFPDQYPFEPPFVRVVRPRFKRQTGFVMNGALCMELLTKDGWNPINDIESVIVSVRSLLVVGDGRIETAFNLSEPKYNALLAAADTKTASASPANSSASAAGGGDSDAASDGVDPVTKRQRKNSEGETGDAQGGNNADAGQQQRRTARDQGGAYSVSEAEAAYSHLSNYHKKKGWDTSGWWARKG